jgi:hypothetical protein
MNKRWKLKSTAGTKGENLLEDGVNLILSQLNSINGRRAGLSDTWNKRAGAVLIGCGEQLKALGKTIRDER